MSKSDFDLELHFLPAWAQESQDTNRYANYAGETPRDERRGRRRDQGGPRPPRRDSQRPPRQDRPQGQGQRPGKPQRGPQRGRPDRDRPLRDREPLPLLELNVAFKPDAKGVESLARQIRMTGRAYPLFDIAQMILRKPERHSITVSVKKKAEGPPAQPLFVCALDQSLHLSQEDAVRYVLAKHFETFYQPEKTKIDGPKGTYTFVAQCGMSGVILGPPNHHDYQNQLHKLHSSRFSRMPFEAFKSRVKIVRDEEVVKKWIEDQSWKTDYVCLNMPEPLKLGSREEVEKHFRETHLANIITQVDSFEMTGVASRELRNPALLRLVRHHWEHQKRFPLQIATVLSQQFASHGLQFFKVNKTVTHVAVARPHYLDLEAEPVSEGVKRIVLYVESHPKCTRRQLISALAPKSTQPAPPTPTPKPAAATESSTPETAAPADPASPASTPPGDNTAAAATPAPAAPAEPEPSPEETAVAVDLHWVIHQGHVIEFANGVLETAKKPAPRPEKKKQPATPAPTDPGSAPTESTEGSTEPKAATAEATTAAAAPAPEPASPTAEVGNPDPPSSNQETPVEPPSTPSSSEAASATKVNDAPTPPVEPTDKSPMPAATPSEPAPPPPATEAQAESAEAASAPEDPEAKKLDPPA